VKVLPLRAVKKLLDINMNLTIIIKNISGTERVREYFGIAGGAGLDRRATISNRIWVVAFFIFTKIN
jgi:hypothetical protein